MCAVSWESAAHAATSAIDHRQIVHSAEQDIVRHHGGGSQNDHVGDYSCASTNPFHFTPGGSTRDNSCRSHMTVDRARLQDRNGARRVLAGTGA